MTNEKSYLADIAYIGQFHVALVPLISPQLNSFVMLSLPILAREYVKCIHN